MSHTAEFWEEVSMQIVKDFGIHLMHWLEEPLPHSRAKLTERLEEEIHVLFFEGMTTIRKVIYRVDISESRLGRLLGNANRGEAGPIIAREIVTREMIKVETRRSFGKGRLDS